MKALKTFEFKAGIGNDSSYEWDKMLDGKIYQLEAGKDYTCKLATFRSLATSAARRVGKTVKVNSVEGGLVIQASPASKETLAHWAEQDAERKAKKAAESEEGTETEGEEAAE